jgi:chromosome segregation ATPase
MKTNLKTAELLAKLQDRISRVAEETANVVDKIEARLNSTDQAVRNIGGVLEVLDNRVTETCQVLEVLDTRIIELRDKEFEAKNNFIRLNSAIASTAERIDEVRFKNDKREEAQTSRDQSSVQSIKELTDRTKVAFEKVQKDVDTLNKSDQRLAERVYQLENAPVAEVPAPEPSLPSDHKWVNNKLASVYEYVTELETRLSKLENHTVGVDFDYGIQEPTTVFAPPVVSKEGFCTDTACSNKGFNEHYFGPGCRFYTVKG